jgi:ubiquinone/menaquinone biosynthesis C-methylase UbiE
VRKPAMKGTNMPNGPEGIGMTKVSGTRATQRFYNETGWKERDGASVDRNLFGVKEDGPIRVRLHRLHVERIRRVLSQAGTRLNLLECGCGGNPERELLDLCSRYTAVDFSDTGIEMARSSFAAVGIEHEFRTADVCALPFKDHTFDAVYCAHMIYHIEDPAAQEAAIAELVRVVRPGGVIVLVTANPRPLAFPMRLARRLVADTALIGPIFNRLRAKPPLPYKPMPIGWMRRRLARGGPVEVLGAGIPSTGFNQNVTEFKGLGRLLWRSIGWLDASFPKLSAYLGNYAILSCRKAPARAR